MPQKVVDFRLVVEAAWSIRAHGGTLHPGSWASTEKWKWNLTKQNPICSLLSCSCDITPLRWWPVEFPSRWPRIAQGGSFYSVGQTWKNTHKHAMNAWSYFWTRMAVGCWSDTFCFTCWTDDVMIVWLIAFIQILYGLVLFMLVFCENWTWMQTGGSQLGFKLDFYWRKNISNTKNPVQPIKGEKCDAH